MAREAVANQDLVRVKACHRLDHLLIRHHHDRENSSPRYRNSRWSAVAIGRQRNLRSSCQVLPVVGTECRRSDSHCGPRPKARIEWHRECWHGGTFGIGEYVVEHAASNVMRVRKRISDAGNDRAATLPAKRERQTSAVSVAMIAATR